MQRPESIENRWDILYRDYPEIYEAFSQTPYHPTVYEQLPGIIDLSGKTIADVGSGTGASTLGLARYAKNVIGIEFEPAMLGVAREKARVEGAQRVAFLGGDALALPLADQSVDLITGVTLALWPPEQYRAFINEGLRVAKDAVVYLGIAPAGYGGDLYEIIDDVDTVEEAVDRIFLEEFHFHYQDITSVQEYGTVERIVSTYGFIFGKKTIDYIQRHQKTAITWTFRVYWKS